MDMLDTTEETIDLQEDATQEPDVPKLSVCTDINLPEGLLTKIYIGPCGIFAIADSSESPELLYRALQTQSGTPHVRLYVEESGLYTPCNKTWEKLSPSTDLEDEIICWTTGRREVLGEESRARIEQQLFLADAKAKGFFEDEDGTIYILRGEDFIPTSRLAPDFLYWLTMFGAPLGLHRFWMGRFGSGLIYLLTAGLFGIGWLMDELALLTGHQRDRRHRLVRVPTHRMKKILAIPIGLLWTAFSLYFYFRIIQLTANGMSAGLQTVLNDPNASNALLGIYHTISHLS